MLFNRYKRIFQFVGYFSANMSTNNYNVAVCQLTATNVKEENLKIVKSLVTEAVSKNAKIVFLPEGCDYIGTSHVETKELAEPLNGPLMLQYKTLASQHKIWLSIGGFHEKQTQHGKDILQNSHVLINEEGEIEAVYRKMHLFDVNIPEKNIDLRESKYVVSGKEIVPPIHSPIGNIGLMICYDMRFPEISVILRKMGADVLTFPSAFTHTTGQAHWEVLLRARAIENQCYVVAAAQYGCHNSSRISFGQAMIVDPWGKVLAECPKYEETVSTNNSIAIAEVNPNLLIKVRMEMPVFEHRRNDVYELIKLDGSSQHESETSHYMFANKIIPVKTVFYVSKYSYAFTNIRCVVPGHVLISSIRPSKRLQNLTQEEVADFFQTAVKVQKVVESAYASSSSTVCVQDGEDAGQSVPQVHCHILPRKTGDFENNDDIYMELAKHDKRDNTKPLRSMEEMTSEAIMLKGFLNSL